MRSRNDDLSRASFLRGVRTENFTIRCLDAADLWATHRNFDKTTLTPDTYADRYRSTDEDDVPLHATGEYSPTTLAFVIDDLTVRYQLELDGDNRRWLLQQAEKAAATLLTLAARHEDGLFLQYPFEHKRGGVRFPNPWVSGMGQGLALGSMARLHHQTGKPEYADAARAMFAAMLRHEDLRTDTRRPWPWVTVVDTDGYLWLEEYPAVPPFHTLNGFVFGIFGVYEYYRYVDRSSETEQFLKALLTTAMHRGVQVRNAGDISSKDLNLRQLKPRKYHHVHIAQMEILYRMTGDLRFYRSMREFKDDEVAYDRLMRPYVESGAHILDALSVLAEEGGGRSEVEAARAEYLLYEWESMMEPTLRRYRNRVQTAFKAVEKNLPADGEWTLAQLAAAHSAADSLRLAIDAQGRMVEWKEAPGPGESEWSTRPLLAAHARLMAPLLTARLNRLTMAIERAWAATARERASEASAER